MRHAVVYERKGVFYIRASSQTTVGVWIDDGPCLAVATDSSPDDIGKAVQAALSSSRSDIPHPTSWKNLNDALLTAAGVKSWSVFGKTAKCISLELEERLRIIPTKNLGSRGGFEAIEERVLIIPSDANLNEIGKSVKTALTSCE